MSEENLFNAWWDEIVYFTDFARFVGAETNGRFLVVITIDYDLLFGYETASDTLTVWSSPQKLTHPLEDCFKVSVTPLVLNTLYRYPGADLIGITFKWQPEDPSKDVDGVFGADVAQSSRSPECDSTSGA